VVQEAKDPEERSTDCHAAAPKDFEV